MKQKKTKPFKPCVTLAEAARYDKDKPETYTKSPVVNAVCEAIAELSPAASIRQIAAYMEVKPVLLSHAVELAVGVSLNDLRAWIVAQRWSEIVDAEPSITRKHLAQRLGYADYTALWRFLQRWKAKGRPIGPSKKATKKYDLKPRNRKEEDDEDWDFEEFTNDTKI